MKYVSNRLFVFVGELVFFLKRRIFLCPLMLLFIPRQCMSWNKHTDASVYSKKCMFVSDAELYSIVSKCLFKSIVSMKKGGRFKTYCKCFCHLGLFYNHLYGTEKSWQVESIVLLLPQIMFFHVLSKRINNIDLIGVSITYISHIQYVHTCVL